MGRSARSAGWRVAITRAGEDDASPRSGEVGSGRLATAAGRGVALTQAGGVSQLQVETVNHVVHRLIDIAHGDAKHAIAVG